MRLLLLAGLVGLAACQVQDEHLSSTEQGVVNGIAFSPVSGQTVGSVQIGQSSAPFAISINTTGLAEQSYTITSITGCSDFSIDAPDLPAEVHRTCLSYCSGSFCQAAAPICEEWDIVGYDFSTTFHPNINGPSSCAIQVTLTSLGIRPYTINGTGTLPPIQIDVTPTTVAFGDVRRNTASTAATITARNAGGQALVVSSAIVTAGFTLTSGPAGTTTIPVGGNQPYSVTCNPTATGPISGSLKITSNDPMSPAIVSLSCNGIDSNLDISPSPAAIPTTRVGEPVTRIITLANTGLASMMLQSTSLTGAGLSPIAMPPPNTTIGPSGSVNATVGFDAMAAGDASGLLTVTYDGGQIRTVAISAKALATSLSISPDGRVDLGAVCVGQSKMTDVTIAANAAGGFKVTQIASPAAPFTLVKPPLPAVVQGSGANHVTMTVGVAPTTVGPQMDSVMVTTDIPASTAHPLELDVVGLTAGISATPPELDLGPSPINATTIGQEVVVTNCATTPETLSNPRLEGDDAGDFAIVQQPNLTVGPNGTATWLVVAQPHSVGSKAAIFSVDHAEGTASVMLSADGLGDEPTGPGSGTPRASYYQCSAGTASGSWPLGLALAALLARRRSRRRPGAAC